MLALNFKQLSNGQHSKYDQFFKPFQPADRLFNGWPLSITFEALKILSAKGKLYQFKKLEKKY